MILNDATTGSISDMKWQFFKVHSNNSYRRYK
jgi:hypothetical protein